MIPLGRNFWLGVFWGFTFFVVISVGVLLIHQITSKKQLLINKEMEAELLNLQRLPPATSLSVYKEAHDWNLQTLTDQKVVFEDFRGKVVFLNFWATWCGPCVAEMPAIQSLYDSLGRSGVGFLLVSDEPMDTLRSYARANRVTVPIYQTTVEVPAVFAVAGLPTTFIVNREGIIMMKHVGGAEWDHPWTTKFLQELLR